MNSRKIIAATVLGLLGGAAFAEGESQIDYTAQHLNNTRAEVVAETQSFNAMHEDFLAQSSEAYGEFDAAGSIWSPSEDSMMAGPVFGPGSQMRVDETYGGFPQVDGVRSRGE